MRKNEHFLVLPILLLILASCNPVKKDETSVETSFTFQNVNPVEFPDVDIPGFTFPEDSSILNGWIRSSATDSMYLHGWGIWTGITSRTDHFIKGDTAPLRVFETWLTPAEMIDSIKGKKIKRSNRANLNVPHQFTHFKTNNTGQQTVNDNIHESVSYNPAAASFAISNKLFLATTLYTYGIIQNLKEIPFFPNNAITIKPVFKLLQTSGGQTMFDIASWHGPTPELVAYPEQDWGTIVTVDVANKSASGGTVYNLNDFIFYTLNDEDAHFFNSHFTENSGNKFNAQPGDIAILVGMHVGTREINNWTWQTFWWAPDPDDPPSPSSRTIANQRPEQLKGSARHYAMSVAYFMVNPNEPYNGSNIEGDTNYAFNPYLEAGFGPDVFNDSISYVLLSSGKKIKTFVGVRTNCMSCHRMATVNPDSLLVAKNSQTPYVGNSYVSVLDSLFKRQLLLDFAWSVQGNVDTTGFSSFIHSQ